ncbi:MAG: response regulator [Alphaproteobacteria bacterium]|nr:response regulator [Alphaproteobacteria bacterium]
MAKILIVEDNQTTLEYLYKSLKKDGHAVISQDNSLDAWRATNADVFDIMIIDVAMPGIDGFVLAQKALQENPSLDIIFITGFAAVAMDTYATPAYAPSPVTTRPFHLTQMAARIRHLMGHGGLPQTAETGDGTVIYADFANSKSEHQAQY